MRTFLAAFSFLLLVLIGMPKNLGRSTAINVKIDVEKKSDATADMKNHFKQACTGD